MSKKKKTANKEYLEVGKIGLRHEGEYWNAYYYFEQKKQLMASIHIGFMETAQAREDFLEFTRTLYKKWMKNVTGVDVETGNERPAPEAERSGHA